MLEGAAFVILGLLPTYATGQLMTTDAKCLPGYEWVCWITYVMNRFIS